MPESAWVAAVLYTGFLHFSIPVTLIRLICSLGCEQLFEDAGVGLGREEMLRVYLALKSLAEQQPLKTVRFWGSCYVC